MIFLLLMLAALVPPEYDAVSIGGWAAVAQFRRGA
jgi:hypothetical protein